jgi:hypothetical protein
MKKKYEVKFLMHFVCFFSELLVVEEGEEEEKQKYGGTNYMEAFLMESSSFCFFH